MGSRYVNIIVDLFIKLSSVGYWFGVFLEWYGDIWCDLFIGSYM